MVDYPPRNGEFVPSLLQKDVQELARIEGLRHLPNLLALLFARAGNLLNIQELQVEWNSRYDFTTLFTASSNPLFN
jgi:hypothetical protein